MESTERNTTLVYPEGWCPLVIFKVALLFIPCSHFLATTWCVSTKCPEPNLPLLIEFCRKRSFQDSESIPGPDPTRGPSMTHHLTTLKLLGNKLFIDYIILFYTNIFACMFEYVCAPTPSTYPLLVISLQVATMHDSPEYRLGLRKNAIVDTGE